MKASTPRRLRSAFTLIELLTVIAIVGILAAILIPVVGKVRASARQAQSVSNLRQIALMFPGYAAENRGNFPWYSVSGAPDDTPDVWHEFLKEYAGKANYESVYACAEWRAQVTKDSGDSMGFGVNTLIYVNGSARNANLGNYDSASGGIRLNTSTTRVTLNSVPSPSRTILLGSAGFIVGDGNGRATWNLDFDRNRTLEAWIDPTRSGTRAGALRHNGKAAYAFYDCSVTVLEPAKAYDILQGR